MDLAGLDGARTAAVGTDDGGRFELALRHHVADTAADAGGLHADDAAVFDVVGNHVVRAAQGGGSHGDVLDAELLHRSLNDHVGHIVAVTQVVMEREGAAVLAAALTQRVGNGLNQLGLLGLFITAGLGGGLLHILAVHIVLALIDLLAAGQEVIGNISAYCVSHTRSPSYSPQARASFSVRSAPGMNAMSIILPSTVNTPTPAALCSR